MKRLIVMFLFLFCLSSLAKANELTDKAWADFTYQLEQFRNHYEVFLVKRDTYERSQTFSAQEELVVAARDMLLARDTVWWTYFQGLKTQLVTNGGFTLEKKQPLEQAFIDEQSFLDGHKNSLLPLTVKNDLLSKAQELNGKSQSYTEKAYGTLIALRFADLRFATNKIQVLAGQLKQAVRSQEHDPNILEVRLRGFDELDRLIGEINEKTNHEETSLAEYGSGFFSKSGYDQTMMKLTPIYQLLKQAQQLVRELARGIDL